MPRKSKMFWTPWAACMSLAAMLILVGAFTPNQAGAQSGKTPAAKVQVTAPASMAYIDVRTVPIVEVPESQPASAPAVKGPDDVQGVTATVRDAMRTSNWRLAVIAGLLLVVLILRRVGGFFWPWFNTDRGGATLALAAGVLTVLVNGLVAGGAFDPQLLVDGLLAAFTAAGAFNVSKRLAKPADKQA